MKGLNLMKRWTLVALCEQQIYLTFTETASRLLIEPIKMLS